MDTSTANVEDFQIKKVSLSELFKNTDSVIEQIKQLSEDVQIPILKSKNKHRIIPDEEEQKDVAVETTHELPMMRNKKKKVIDDDDNYVDHKNGRKSVDPTQF